MAWEMQLTLYTLWIGLCCIGGIWSLKCRNQDNGSDAELKRIVRSCMQRGGGGGGSGSALGGNDPDERRYNGQNYHFDNNYYGFDDANQQRANDRDRTNYGSQHDTGLRRGVKQQLDTTGGKTKNTTGEGSSCLAHCFFEQMSMIDSNGLPDRRKVSYLLTKDIRDRELRNFYMDTVQQCFRYVENFRQNKCELSRELIKCMSEYAKAQCEDWEDYSNLLFN